MADTLKFGPEWLRQLSGGNSIGTPPPSPAPGFGKYKLADYRYGREEMLALYTPSPGVPDELKDLNAILSEKPQEPLAFQPLSEEEQRIMSQSVNSQAVLRAMGRGPPMRGRGVGLERGRGRGRGRGDGFMQRGVSYDENDGGPGGFGRPRQRPDGSWDEGDPKGFHGHNKMYQRSLSSENWRDREEEEEEGGDWRKAGSGSKWGTNTRGSWRDNRWGTGVYGIGGKGVKVGDQHVRLVEGQQVGHRGVRDWRKGGQSGGPTHRAPGGTTDGAQGCMGLEERGSKWGTNTGYDPGYNQAGRGYTRQYSRQRSGENWDEEEVPEWSTDGDPDELGTFDASGAFVSPNRKGFRREYEDREELESPRSGGGTPDSNRERLKDVNPKGAASQGMKEALDNRNKKPIEKPDVKTDTDDSPLATPPPKSKIAQSGDNKHLSSGDDKKQPVKNSASTQPSPKPVPKVEMVPPQKTPPEKIDKEPTDKNATSIKKDEQKKENDKAAKTDNSGEKCDKTTVAKTTKSAAALGASDAKPESAVNKAASVANTGGQTNKKKEKINSEVEALNQLQEKVENMVAGITITEEEEERRSALPPDHEHYNKWFYRDPQGDLQGPFASTEMAEWFSAGYFTMNLQVRRGCDEVFSPLGELIKRWGRVPFLPGQMPPPLMNNISPATESPPQQHQQQPQQQQPQQQQQQQWQDPGQAVADHQQFLQQYVQQQMQQQQMLMRQLQLQQQLQQVMTQLQESSHFKALSPLQQQQLVLQIMAKQSVLPAQQHPQRLSPRYLHAKIQQKLLLLSPMTTPPPMVNPVPAFSASSSSQGGALPASIWDIDPASIASMPTTGISAADLEAHLKEKEIEAEKEQQERLKQEREKLRREQEEVQRQKEEIERQRQEFEQRRQDDLKKMEEERFRAEEEKKRYEEEQRTRLLEEQRVRQKQEEERKTRQMEEHRSREEEEQVRQMEVEQRKREEEGRQKEAQRKQEAQKQLEAQKQRDQQLALQRQQQQQQEEVMRKHQQDALRKIQQEQLANMQLPSHVQWASGGGSPLVSSNGGRSLLEIQQQEERERLARDELLKKQQESQRQQMLALQQQQQQQKSWTSTVSPPSSAKSLLEIQQEQARQLERERQKREENQQHVAKNMTLGSASVWGSGAGVNNWANEGAWGALKNAQLAGSDSSLGFWDEAIISSGPAKKTAPKQNSGKQQGTTDFPALPGGGNSNKGRNSGSQNKAKPSKTKKDEEAVQRLFQAPVQEDDFTSWCRKQLNSMDTSVDIPTFVAFLLEVESPYEVHDYIRSYLGESKASEEFGKAFLEKRSQTRNQSKPAQAMDSIWGPAVAITPRELRQLPQPHTSTDDMQKGKPNKKKKSKMMKLDSSILGFTVHAAPDRMVGEIDSLETANTR
ncbi:GRB10-interacting GYF protein 2-like [Dreissena polymorpha]|uniref:GRB10-interacting GYF protein 2-like n=1 Tax=Dreissena polymorpha TaxID=45954 RepID=UPI00226534B0|nr:GRB10-interacting GYF protein 2-like [Dreissena polymorpha]